jgi:hypothetical protein
MGTITIRKLKNTILFPTDQNSCTKEIQERVAEGYKKENQQHILEYTSEYQKSNTCSVRKNAVVLF